MRTKINETSVQLWLSARDTYQWATRPNASWPCSQLKNKRVFACFDSNGLVDLAIDGKQKDCDASEFNAITFDFLKGKLPENHPCYFVSVGQFNS